MHSYDVIRACQEASTLVMFAPIGRGPPFAYWRKVGLQAYSKICSGVLCNIVVKSLCIAHSGSDY